MGQELRWMMIGSLEVKHRQPESEYYPEDEGRVRGWKREGSTDLWAEAALLTAKETQLGSQLAMWMNVYGYRVQMRLGKDQLVVLYQHPELVLNLRTAWEPVVLR